MNDSWGEMTIGTQRSRGISGKNDGSAAKWTACGLLRDHVVETGLAKLVRDVVGFVEDDKGVSVLEANEALLKAERRIRGKHASAEQTLRRNVYFRRFTFFKR